MGLVGCNAGLDRKSDRGEEGLRVKTEVDVTAWPSGKHQEEILIDLPEDMEPGDCKIEIGISGLNYPMVYFATDAERNGAYYQLGCIKVL